MDTFDCIKGRRSIRKFQGQAVPRDVLEDIIAAAAYAPSWKNTQITRYTAVEDAALLEEIAQKYAPAYNSKIIRSAPLVLAVSIRTKRCGYERDGSYTTEKKDGWQMFDAGIASQTLCLAAHAKGIGTVIMGIFDYQAVADLLEIPEDQELVALIAAGYPDISPEAPKRKSVSDLLSYK